MNPLHALSDFHSWCDRWCERCPLAAACPIPGATGDPIRALEDALEMLQAVAEEAGLSLDELPPPPPPPLEARLLADAGRAHAFALVAAGQGREGMLVAGKTARIASFLDLPGDAVWEEDAVPNLMLLERLLAGCDAELEDRRVSANPASLVRARETRRRLGLVLDPLLAAVPEETRRVIDVLVAARVAPSPFVITR